MSQIVLISRTNQAWIGKLREFHFKHRPIRYSKADSVLVSEARMTLQQEVRNPASLSSPGLVHSVAVFYAADARLSTNVVRLEALLERRK